jgi:hypothetical protein
VETDSSSVGSMSPESLSVPLTCIPSPDESWNSGSNHELETNN